MKYEVIARRYRPRRFEEVVGQEAVAQTLRGAIVQDRLAHAYLFCGPRGVGKTSLARIFAKALNCPRAADRSRPREEWAVPCNECSVCEAIHNGRDIDVIEMDGASHRGIEDIRQIVEGVNRPATRGHYKIYIIDEVHMLTREAFNALLKTLEEPPGHVKFIFATTEPHKIPDTVISRVQRFDIQPVGLEDIARRLRQICDAEKREAPDELLLRIARYSKGGLRDSQTLLDQLMTFCDGELTLEALDLLTGRVAEIAVAAIVDGALTGDAERVLASVRECFGRGADPSILLEQVIESLHARMAELVRSEASRADGTLDRVVGSLQILLETAMRLRSSAYPDIAVELSLVKLARLPDPRGFERALERLASVEAGRAVRPSRGGTREPLRETALGAPRRPSNDVSGTNAPSRSRAMGESEDIDGEPPPAAFAAAAGGGRIGGDDSPALPSSPAARADAVVVDQVEAAMPADPSRLFALWEQILIELQEKHPSIAPYVAGGVPDPRTDGTLVLRFGKKFAWTQMRGGTRLASLEALVRDVTGAPWSVRIEFDPNARPIEPKSTAPPGPVSTATPARRPESTGRATSARPDAANGAGGPSASPGPTAAAPSGKLQDEIVDKAMKLFNARPV